MTAPEHSMSLLDHLVELRRRLLWCAVFFLGAFAVCYVFADDIYQIMAWPLEKKLRHYTEQPRMIYTALWEVFFVQIKVALYAALYVSFPFLAIQIWKFVAPGLYYHEKQVFLPFLIATPFLFALGVLMFYFLVFPAALDFFLGFQSMSQGGMDVVLEAKVDQYFSIVVLMFIFGVSFELPVLLTLLVRAGIVSVETLRRQRRMAIVIIFVIAAVVTPPDVISQIGLALPMVLLYEISIICGNFVERRRKSFQSDDELENETPC